MRNAWDFPAGVSAMSSLSLPRVKTRNIKQNVRENEGWSPSEMTPRTTTPKTG